METKRLFVGGLYRGVKEEDLRERFKAFGTVSSVEIVRRVDDEGHAFKTFAFLDMIQTETDFRRCVSILSSSKWKGYYLKVQAAKESFLTRLSRERQEQGQATLNGGVDVKGKLSCEEKHPEQFIPETLPKAVPGTPIPGKKNWVVGKFGRVMPVMYLRRRDRKKIAKFDPSKTTHCLKRLTTEESPESSLADLTWSLDAQRPILNGGSLKSERNSTQMDNERRKNSSVNVGGSAFKTNSVYDKMKKSSDSRAEKCNDHSLERNLLDCSVSDLGSKSSAMHSEQGSRSQKYKNLVKSSSSKAEKLKAPAPSVTESECDVSSSHNDIKTRITSKTSCDPGTESTSCRNNMKGLSNLIQLNGGSDSKMSKGMNGVWHKLSENSGEFGRGEKKKDVEKTRLNKVQSSDSSDDSSDTVTSLDLSDEERAVIKIIGKRKSSSQAEGSASEARTSHSSVKNCDSSMSKDKTLSVDHESVASRNGARETKQSFGPGSKDLSFGSQQIKTPLKMKNEKTKKELSNEKRLGALFERQKSAAAQKDIIKDALKALDCPMRSGDGMKHIVFDDNEDDVDDSVTEKTVDAVGEKISGSKASSWLGLEGDSDEDSGQMTDDFDSDHDKDAKLVKEKPQFEGKAGEELFKLQKTYFGDKRFVLDSRFLESDEDDEAAADDYRERVTGERKRVKSKEPMNTHDEDDTSRSLKEEKEMELRVLGSILGTDLRAEFDQEEIQVKESGFRNLEAVRYDPSREDHKQFERVNTEPEKEEEEEQEKKKASVKKKQGEDPVLPKVSLDKYYEVNTTSLIDLFGNNKEGSSKFTFLSQEPLESKDSIDVEHSDISPPEDILKNPWQPALKLPYDSSDDNEEDGDDMIADAFVSPDDQPVMSSKPLEELFFFHPDDSQLTNRINDDIEPFMRNEGQEDVRAYWLSVRYELKLDYKRQRKDAIRLQRKMDMKRSRHR